MHEIGSTIGHKTQYLITNDLGIHGLSNVLFDHSLVVSLFHVEMLAFLDKVIGQMRGHQHFVFKKNIE